jgi:hypothetical protein
MRPMWAMPRTAIAFHQRVAFSVNAVVKFFDRAPEGGLARCGRASKKEPQALR